MEATMTLPIGAELQSLLARKAQAHGVNVETYALETLKRVAELPTISELFAETGAAFIASGKTEEELEADIEFALSEVRAQRSGE